MPPEASLVRESREAAPLLQAAENPVMNDARPTCDFGTFYAATIVPLRRRLRRMLGSHEDSEDVAHDAYRRMYEVLETRPVERPEGFLFTTARRLALDQLRRRRIAPVRSGDDRIIELAPSPAPGVEQRVMARQEYADLEAAIEGLPPGCRTVLRLCKFEHLSHAEISDRLGIAVSTVEKQHSRALRLLRAVLHEDAWDDGKPERTTEM